MAGTSFRVRYRAAMGATTSRYAGASKGSTRYQMIPPGPPARATTHWSGPGTADGEANHATAGMPTSAANTAPSTTLGTTCLLNTTCLQVVLRLTLPGFEGTELARRPGQSEVKALQAWLILLIPSCLSSPHGPLDSNPPLLNWAPFLRAPWGSQAGAPSLVTTSWRFDRLPALE